jgi:hypothetical protein
MNYKSEDVEDKIIVEEIIRGNKSTALLNIRNVDNCLAKLAQEFLKSGQDRIFEKC